MLNLPENYRLFEFSKIIFNEILEDRIKVESQASKNKESFDPTKNNLGEKLGEFEMKYGEASYRAVIQEKVDELMPETTTDKDEIKNLKQAHKKILIEDSVARYMYHYQAIKNKFIEESTALETSYQHAEKEIVGRTKDELEKLKAILEKTKEVIGMEQENIPSVENDREVNRYFDQYLDALNEHYFNPKVTDGDEASYLLESRAFKSKIKEWTQDRLNYIRETKGDQAQLESFKKEIADRYKRYANFDGKGSKISSADLRVLNDRMKPKNEQIEAFLDQADAKNYSETSRQFLWRLEDYKMMNKDAWKNHINILASKTIDEVRNDHVEEKFIAEVNKTIEPVNNFRQAKRAFTQHLEKLSEGTVQGVTRFIEDFNGKVLDSTLKPYRELEKDFDESYNRKVNHEIDILLSGQFIPERPSDRMLVSFIQGNRKHRESILSNEVSKQSLLRAIAEATQAYPENYEKRFSGTPGKSRNLEPFRLKALIVLGHQAKEIVANYNPNSSKEIQGMTVKTESVQPSLDFKPTIQSTPNFRPAIMRNGFNGRDLGLKAAKILGALAIATNFIQDFTATNNAKDANGKDLNLAQRLAEAVKNTMTNPGTLAGALAMGVAYKGEQDPRYLKFPWLSPDEQQDVLTADKLESIGSKTSIKHRDRLLGNEMEWKVAKRLMENREKFKNLMQMSRAEKSKGGQPVISADLLVKAGVLDKTKDADIYHFLSQGTNRTRYLFYENFLQSDKANIHDIKAHVTGSDYIAT